MDDLLAEFIAETREQLDAIGGELVAWEADPSDRDRLDAIFRFVHTVKGSCGFLDLPRLQDLSHEAENALSEVREGRRKPDAEFVSAILAILDRIGDLVDLLEDGEDIGSDGEDVLIAALAGDTDGSGDTTEAEDAGSREEDDKPAAKPGSRRSPARSIRVPVELLDRLMAGVSDLVLARNELSRQLRRVGGNHDLDNAFERISGCVAEMRDAITWTRMQRIEGLFAALPRLVRDLSAELGKQVALEIDGADVEMDREMIEMLRDPLTHIVRNALDHGIEAPAARRAAGKPETGTLHVSARQSGNQIRIAIADDGAGIDTARLIDRARAARLIDVGAVLSDAEAIDLVFHPGLSTARQVNQISGRGVGMDVVRANIERIGGSIELASDRGAGTTLILSVPLTLTIIPALIVGVGRELFAIPRSAIDEIVSLAKVAGRIEAVGGTEILQLRSARMPLVRLAAVFGREPAADDASLVVLRPSRSERFALAVTRVFDHEELVVRPAAPGIMAAGVYAGTALPDNGRPLLLLDTAGIAAKAGLRLSIASRGSADQASEAVSDEGVPALVFEDLDGRRRAIRMGIADRIIEADVAEIEEAAGAGRLVIGEEMITVVASGPLPESGKVRLIRLSDGTSQLGYATGGPADVRGLPATIEPSGRPGRVAGVAILDGAPVEILDPHALFAEQDEAAPSYGERPVCRLEGGDERWVHEVLGPLVEAAGYRVVFDETTEADVIVQADESADGSAPAGKVVRLAPTPDAGPDRIYRYDRTGIVTALRSRLIAGGGKA